MLGKKKNRLGAGLVVGGAVLALTSTAWGCVSFIGKMTVVGNGGPGIVTAIGTGNDMNWCSGYPLGKAKATLGGTVTVKLVPNPASACSPGIRLASGTYSVNYAFSGAHLRSGPKDVDNTDGSRPWIVDCMNPPNPTNSRFVGTLAIDNFGKGIGTYTIPNAGAVSGPTDEAGICVSDMLANTGNQAPLTII